MVYTTEVPFYSIMETDIAVEGDWIIGMCVYTGGCVPRGWDPKP
jgi:hypothetical protein